MDLVIFSPDEDALLGVASNITKYYKRQQNRMDKVES